MRQKSGPHGTAEAHVKEIRRSTRRQRAFLQQKKSSPCAHQFCHAPGFHPAISGTRQPEKSFHNPAAYSCRSASIGLRRAACRAGK